MFVRNESFQQFIRYYPIITWIVGINTFLFLLSFLLPTIYQQYIYVWGVGWNDAVAAGEYWRLITPIFLHGGIGHYLFNNFALIIFGPALETLIGRLKFIGLYFFAGILGNVGTFLFEIGHYFHLGASGAIYGLLGVYIYMRFFRQDLMDPSSAQMVTTIVVIGAIYTLLMPNINVLGHLFGFIGGAIVGPVLFKGKSKYFSMSNIPGYRPSRVRQESEITFDPNRWIKHKRRNKIIKYGVIALVIILILINLIKG